MRPDDLQAQIYASLDALQIPFTTLTHDAVYSMEECTPLLAQSGAIYCKNLFLCNRQQTTFYLLLTMPDKPFRTSTFSKALGVSRLSFAPDDQLQSLLHVQPGSVSPMALLFDTSCRVRLVMDRALADAKTLAFHPCDNRATVILNTNDFLQTFLAFTKHEPTLVSLSNVHEEKIR